MLAELQDPAFAPRVSAMAASVRTFPVADREKAAALKAKGTMEEFVIDASKSK